jgi:predicted acylesterase/phospholipase RssA
MPDPISDGRAFLGGTQLSFKEANALWKALKQQDEIHLARRVLARLRKREGIRDKVPVSEAPALCREEAELTSKDPELGSARRHDLAIQILEEEFDLATETGGKTLGVAGGIHKRRWNDLGQLADLKMAASLYERGSAGPFGEDAYPHINAAFLDDLLACTGDQPEARREAARVLRERIVRDLEPRQSWWNVATRAEALFGLRRYAEATLVISEARDLRPAPWELQTTTRQLAHLAHLQESQPLELPEIRTFFETLLPGQPEAIRSAMVGKVGLALSGGGFRASFYHLGVLARLAELDVLRHVEVLSCVSGGSIVGACYWLALRQRLSESVHLHRDDYASVVRQTIEHFMSAVAIDLRGQARPGKARAIWAFATGKKGALDPELVGTALDEHFYRPLLPGKNPLCMHDLPFEPKGHDAVTLGSRFQPGKHNWLRADKVPVLVLNATTVNTGHAWQFTPTWMGESPWAIHESADSVPRLEWSQYVSGKWSIELGRAVAASASVPLLFSPLRLQGGYDGIELNLVDGGVHDNQGTASLLALNCNVVLVSDAAGQLTFEERPNEGVRGLAEYAIRSMNTLMERIRLTNYVDLDARRRSGLLRGLMFLHMKAGLDADTRRLQFSQEPYEIRRVPLSPSGVRQDFQKALAELRTDLNIFTVDEAYGLMACGYQMATSAFARDLAGLTELWREPDSPLPPWPFAGLLAEITSTEPHTSSRETLLSQFRDGTKVRV